MVEMLPSPWESHFEDLLRNCQASLLICSPYISRGPCERLVRCLDRPKSSSPTVHLLTDLSTDNLLSGSTDASALVVLAESLATVRFQYLPRLHAKVYVRDDAEAVVTSGNMTEGGLTRNHELGVRVLDPAVVAAIRTHIDHLSSLGAPISLEELRVVADAATDLRRRWRAAEESARKDVKEAFESRVGEVRDALLRIRVSGRTVNAIFSDTVLFLLGKGPMKTPDIHSEVQRLHPDLCDDTVDRVINGQRFGKKWKHAVRVAQSHLKDEGRIALTDEHWHLVPGA